jgi:hypothetical protein
MVRSYFAAFRRFAWAMLRCRGRMVAARPVAASTSLAHRAVSAWS